MLNRGLPTDAGAGGAGRKWRLDRATGEWTTAPAEPGKARPNPTPPATAPTVVLTTSNGNGPGVGFYSQPIIQVQAAMPVYQPLGQPDGVAAPPTRPGTRSLVAFLHADVLLPLVAAFIVLIVFLAWAA